MRPIYEMQLIQIEITNACHIGCANCTRFCGHHRKPFFMDIETVVKAVESLEKYPGHIGIMGGEPTLHPQFEQICKILQEMVPDKRRRELWTAGYKWEQYKPIIEATFDSDLIAYNDHSSSDGKHQPLLVAVEEVIEDEQLMWELIDNCWVQNRWSASIVPKGGFFCEVAAAMDMLFDGPGGYPIEEGWWNKNPWEFVDQVKRYCPMCSGAVPLERLSDRGKCDLISPNNAVRLERVKSPKFLRGEIEIFEGKCTPEDLAEHTKGWQPQNYRTFVAHRPQDYENKSLKSFNEAVDRK